MFTYIKSLFHYMSVDEAKSHGFTHHGSLYGIPVYLTEGDCPMISVKFGLMEYVLDFAEIVKRTINVQNVEIIYKGTI